MRGPGLIAAILALGSVVLGGCASNGPNLDELAADRTILTGGVSSKTAGDAGERSDEATIRNAVTSVDLEELPDGRIPWANPDTGSRGEIRDVAEFREGETLCRRFETSRESFRGVGLYSGETCLLPSGLWWMRAFLPV